MNSRNLFFVAFATLALVGGCDDKKDQNQSNAKPAQAAAQPVSSVLHPPKDWGSPTSGSSQETDYLVKNYYVIFDGSGSMAESECSGGNRDGRIVPARRAMAQFGKNLSVKDNLGLYVFDARGASERVTLSSGMNNRKLYDQTVGNVIAGGGTPLGDAIYRGYEALRVQSVKQNGYGEYHIVVVTDGEATDPSVMKQAVAEISQTPVILETIGFCIAQGHALNQYGKTIYRNAMNPDELARGLSSVLAETETFNVSNFGDTK